MYRRSAYRRRPAPPDTRRKSPTGSRKSRKSLFRDRRGAAILELALALPILTMFLFGILSGGSWLAMSHVVQESANEGARAALPGLTATERATLAGDAVRSVLARNYGITPAQVTLSVQDDGQKLTVGVSYDGSSNPLLRLPIVPAATTTIRRQASVVLAGL